MEKLISITSAFLIILLALQISAYAQIPNNLNEEETHQNVCGKEKITKLRFYLHDVLAGPNQTVWLVARSNISSISPSMFGLLMALDNLVTSGPEIDSEEVGRMQGLVGLSDFHEQALVMVLNVVFTKGEYKGSTLSILGRNPLHREQREVPVVGGTGVFRMARGYVITRTHFKSKDNSYGVYEYNVVVFHMDYKV